MKATKRLYYNSDKTKLVDGDSPEAAWPACSAGEEVPTIGKTEKPDANKVHNRPSGV